MDLIIFRDLLHYLVKIWDDSRSSTKKQFAPIYKTTETVEISLDYEAQLLIAEAKSNYHT